MITKIKIKKQNRSVRYSRRLYCFDEDSFIKTQIEATRENIKYETIEPKYAYVIHRAIVAKTHTKDYAEKGFRLNKKVNKEKVKEDPTARLNSLSYLFGGSDQQIKKIVDNLIEWNVIQVKLKHQAGVRSTSYKLSSEWENKMIRMKYYSGKNGSIIYKLNELNEEKLKHPLAKATQEMYDHHVSFSNEGIAFVKERYHNVNVDTIADALLDGTFENRKHELQELRCKVSINQNDTALIEFFMKDCHCSTIQKGKRIYHTLTWLNREYRRYVRIDDKPMIEVDMSNSQPTFSAALLKKIFKVYKPLLGEPVPHDLEQYTQLCINGELYEKIANHACIELTKENRTQFKEDFFAQVFYPKISERKGKVKTAFMELFPTVYQMIVGIKRENYKQFPVLLQDLEASVMVYHVYQQLLKEGYHVLVLHDAIYCGCEEAALRAKELIRESFKSWFDMDILFKDERN